VKTVFALSLAVCITLVTAVTTYLLLVAVAAYFFRKKAVYGGKPLKLALSFPPTTRRGT
jgi:hypothetical protein